MAGINWQRQVSPKLTVLFGSLTNSRQYFDAGLQVSVRNIRQQFVPKIVGCPVNLCNHTLGAVG